MPSLSFFANERDAPPLLDWLNCDPEIAFLVPDGPPDPLESYVERVRALLGATPEAVNLYPWFTIADAGPGQRWKAVRTVERLRDGKHALWHVPSGPLPPSNNPWAGWTEHGSSADPAMPSLRSEHPAGIYLELWTRHRPYSRVERATLPMLFSYWTGVQELLVVSTFAWTGDQRGPASRPAWRWWRRLETWVAEHAIPFADLSLAGRRGDAQRWDCWVFPSAAAKLKSGIAYDARGWDTGEVAPLLVPATMLD